MGGGGTQVPFRYLLLNGCIRDIVRKGTESVNFLNR